MEQEREAVLQRASRGLASALAVARVAPRERAQALEWQRAFALQ
jgi:hypothetical protein